MKRIRFWGTRGSLPVALTAAAVRQKIVMALRGASGRTFASDADIGRYVDGLAFPVAGTYGGNTSCVEIETGGPDYVLCDLGSGVRAFGQAALARHGPASPQTYHIFMSHVHWDHIMGLPFFTPAYIPGNRIRHLRQPSLARVGVAPPAGRAVVSRGLLVPAREHRVRAPRARQAPCGRRDDGHHDAAAARRRFVRLSLRSRRAVHHLHDRFGAPACRRRGDRELHQLLPRRRRRDIRRDVFARRAVSIRADWGHSSNVVAVELCQMAGRAASLPVPPRAGIRRPGDRNDVGRNAAPRGDHADRGAAARHRGL